MRSTRSLTAFVGVFAAVLLAGAAGAVEVGEKAPEFTLTSPAGKPVKLGDLLGKGPVVIYTFISAVNAT